MKIDNRLLAYIQLENDEPFIDIVKISKKGSSFYYEETWWMREAVQMNHYCINDKGEGLKIRPLSRSSHLYDNDTAIKIKESAQARYESWLKGELKNRPT